MKKLYSFSFLFLTTICSTSLKAQSNNSIKSAKSIYLEAGGAGLSYSFNYDFRLKGESGFGFRAGVSYISREDDIKMYSVPWQVNYLLGKQTNFFELGVGATYFYLDDYLYYGSSDESEFLLPVKTKGDVMFTMTFGFRHQPKQGLMYRLAVTPVANRSGFWPAFAGLSFGYSF